MWRFKGTSTPAAAGVGFHSVLFFSVSVLRDISERGRELEQVLTQYITFVKPAFEEFCLPASDIHNLHHTCSGAEADWYVTVIIYWSLWT